MTSVFLANYYGDQSKACGMGGAWGTQTGGEDKARELLVGKHEGKSTLGRPKHRRGRY